MSTFRLAHISDLHLPPPPLAFRLRDLASKRLLSRFAWARKKHRRHRREVVDAIVADIRTQGVDHLAVTGDIMNFSAPEEYGQAVAWLETLGEPSAVTVSPGNHDALVGYDLPDAFAPLRPWLGDAGDGFPYLRIRGRVAIVNLSTAVPTPVHSAQGWLGERQIAALDALLQETAERGLYRLILIHHPVAEGIVSARKRLTDGPAFRAVVRRHGAHLILHGHAHEALLTAVEGPGGPVPVLGVPAGSTPLGVRDQPARWNLIEIEEIREGFATRVSARGLVEGLSVGPLGAFDLC